MTFDFKKLGIKNSKKKEPEKCLFIRGPVPVAWMAKANELKPSASQIGLILWHLVGMKKDRTVVLTNKKLKDFHLSRVKKYIGLRALEEAGLVKVQWRQKANPIVTIIDI